jgi:hypothetical protein
LQISLKEIEKTFQSICRLEEDKWKNWGLSDDLMTILHLSAKLRKERAIWKAEAHRNRNRNRNPSRNQNPSRGPLEDQTSCSLCSHLEQHLHCTQKIYVCQKAPLSDITGKVIVPSNEEILVRILVISSIPHLYFPSSHQKKLDLLVKLFLCKRSTLKSSSSDKIYIPDVADLCFY